VSAAVTVDLADPTPPYEQLRRQFATLIETGQLVRGDRLPPLRQLARDLDLAVGTVARTYRELEQGGLVRSRRGGGTVVSDQVIASGANQRLRLATAAESYAAQARTLGVSRDEALAAVTRAWPSG
jgi:DNA-binding transcriptional regulator YhcF (GntR family)